MKTRIALVALSASLGSLLAAAPAFAADEGGDLAVAQAAAPPKARAAFQLELVPTGKLGVKATGIDQTYTAAFAYGIGGTFDYDVTPNLSIGLAPRLIFNVINKDAPSGAEAEKELDLRVRATAHFPIAPKLTLYGFAAPGYSIILQGDDARTDDPAGFVLGLGGGVTFDVAPRVFLAGELGYQLGFQSVTYMGESADVTTDLLSISLGGGARF
jgi:hypothetical protein